MSFIDSLLSKFVPHACIGCDYEGKLLCDDCVRLLPPAPVAKAGGNLSNIRSVTIYKDNAKELVWRLKSSGAQAAASAMAEQMSGLLINHDPNSLIVPVPTAASRVRMRGYDQAKLLAKSLSRYNGLAYADCLVRFGNAHQVGSSRQERLSQMQRSPFKVKGKTDLPIILVDDVTTTGATLEAAAEALKKAGAESIQAVTFAQA
jgi:ComF family protein